MTLLLCFACVLLLQMIYGIDQSTWQANPYNDISFQQAVAASCESAFDILYTDVTISSVASVTADAHRGPPTLVIADTSSSSSVLVSYLIRPTVPGYDSAAAPYEALLAALSNAVATEVFTAYLQAFAAAHDLSAMSAAWSSSNITELYGTSIPTLAPTTSTYSQKSSKSSVSGAVVAAIVVCTLIGTAALCLLLCCSAKAEIEKSTTVVTGQRVTKSSSSSSLNGVSAGAVDGDVAIALAVPRVREDSPPATSISDCSSHSGRYWRSWRDRRDRRDRRDSPDRGRNRAYAKSPEEF
jgi:hypothetical protein